MTKTIIQIYEIQSPGEARLLMEMGVDCVGSVITSCEERHDPVVRETVSMVRRKGGVSSLIPLFSDQDAVFNMIDYYQPHIVHFCDTFAEKKGDPIADALSLQAAVKKEFPKLKIMRSIPIPQPFAPDAEAILEMAARLEPVTDFFLTDTIIVSGGKEENNDQPVEGFVGITGITCDWQVAAQLVECSSIPVILAGGISPENVAEGIQTVRPFGVDSCTRTNALDKNGQTIRFKKDVNRVRLLVENVRRADGIV